MSNGEIVEQLRHRRAKISELRAIQTSADVRTLLDAEAYYVDAMIAYREKHSDMSGIILPKQ